MAAADTTQARPRIHLERIHVRGLRGLRSLTLPEDGLGWDSGEIPDIVVLAELRRVWRRGSLILIDEPELHLHDRWQARLLDVLRAMQRELGGQVIVTTQSHSLFEMAELGTRARLGREGFR